MARNANQTSEDEVAETTNKIINLCNETLYSITNNIKSKY